MNTQTSSTITVVLAHNLVRAAKHCISASGLVIPQGTTGRILEYTPTGGLIVDFGALPVFFIPAGSSLVEVVNGGEK